MTLRIVMALLLMVLVCWLGLAEPEMPVTVIELFESTGIKLLGLSLIAWISTANLPMAMIIGGLYVLLDQSLQQQAVAEHFVSEIQYDSFSGNPVQEF